MPRYRFIVLAIGVLSILAMSCSDTTEPAPEPLDPALIGTWYNVSPGIDPWPNNYFGIRVSADGTVLLLGVETETGKLGVLGRCTDGCPEYTVLRAGGGEIVVRQSGSTFGQPYTRTVIGTYLIDNSRVVFNDVLLGPRDVYDRPPKDLIVTDPIVCEFEAQVDGEAFVRPPVYPSPAARAKFIMDPAGDVLTIQSSSDGFYTMMIWIQGFEEPGVFDIVPNPQYGEAFAAYTAVMPAQGAPVQQELSGRVTITAFDRVGRRCEGTFEWTSANHAVTGGTFSVPVYVLQ